VAQVDPATSRRCRKSRGVCPSTGCAGRLPFGRIPFKTDESGIVLIMNLTNPGEAHELLEKLPLGQAGMMEFEFIPLGPIKPLALLLTEHPDEH